MKWVLTFLVRTYALPLLDKGPETKRVSPSSAAFPLLFLIDLDPPVGGGPPLGLGRPRSIKKGTPGRVRWVAKRTRQSL
jgi:hypothetical protein